MNKIINKFLLTGDKVMSKLLLNQPGFTFRACGLFDGLYDAAQSDSKDLAKTTISDKILKDRPYEIARNCSYDEYQKTLVSMV